MGVVPPLRAMGSALWDKGDGEREIIHMPLWSFELMIWYNRRDSGLSFHLSNLYNL